MAEQTEPMRIIRFEATNFMRLHAVAIQPDGTALVRIEGKNAQGKTSALRAIECALAGARSTPVKPVRNGASRAEVKIDLGELTIRRSWTEAGTMTLEVKARDGSTIKTPQQVLDALYGEMLDPVAFSRMKPAEQAAELRRVAGIDLTELDHQEADIFEERKQASRDLKTAEARLPAPPTIPPGLPDKAVSVAELSKEMTEAADANRFMRDQQQALIQKRNERERIKSSIALKEAELVSLRQQLQAVGEEGKVLHDLVSKLVARDVEAIQARIGQAEETNRIIAARDARRAQQAEVDRLHEGVKAIESRLEAVRASKVEIVASAKFPIEGLGIEGDTVMLNGQPFSQASSSEQLRAGVAIGMAQNPRLRVMLIRDGSLLDEAALADLTHIAEHYDAQIFIERVADTVNPAAVYIQDGEVVSSPAPVTA